jgi:3-oxoacyl-[acyl-carrier protein] reductase
MFDLTDKRALVTGASGSIGAGIARALHAQGAVVGLSGTRRDALEALAAELGPRTHVLPCDLSDGAQVDELIPQTEAAIGELDILVNNAGLNRDNLLVRIADADWDKVIAVDLTAAFKLCRLALRPMMRKRWGRVISISSVVAFTGNAGQGNYAAAKAGLIGMTKSLAQEVASRGVTVNSVSPGYIGTDMVKAVRPEVLEKIVGTIPVKRLGEPSEIASIVAWLASDESAFATGADFSVNGGLHMG